jgi:hypothetical protein
MVLDKLRARRALFPAGPRVTAIVAALTSGCLGSIAGGPDDAVDTDAASRHAGHDASTRDAREAGRDARDRGDAGRTADARAADVAGDATTLDASVREASPPVDAPPHDATQHVEAMAEAGPVDAGHDATAADAANGDAAPVCAYPDASTGTMDVLAEVPGVTIQDFDIDSTNVFFTTSTGGVLSCPATGCAGAPAQVRGPCVAPDAHVNPSASRFLIRIGVGGLVLAASVPTGEGPFTTLNLYALGRDGGNVELLPEQVHADWSGFVAPRALALAGGQVFYTAIAGINSGETWLGASTDVEWGNATNAVFLASWGDFGYSGYADQALVGPTLYALLEEDFGSTSPLPPARLFLLNALADGGAPAPFYATSPITFDVSGWSFAASATLVAAAGTVLGDGGVTFADGGTFGQTGFHTVDAGGASGLFVCPAGGPCAQPTKVAGVAAKSIKALYADATTLYFTDTSNNLFSCDAAAALAGSCAPKLLACPAPAFSELRSDADHVYLLKADGSAILRIAR